MSARLFSDIHKKVHKLFTYVPDEKNYKLTEHWTSHSDDVNANRKFSDDCDGFALTCAELLIEAHVPRKDVYAIVCKTETGEGHLVCGAYDNKTDSVWILENRYDKMYRRDKKSSYDWLFWMDFSDPGQWHKFE